MRRPYRHAPIRTGRRSSVRRRAFGLLTALVAGVLLAACGSSGSSGSTTSGSAASGSTAGASGGGVPVRIGYFPNLTHAPALVADAEGFFTKRLGSGVSIKTFNAGPDVIQAIFSNSLDISYVGPNPTITAYAQSKGSAIKVIAGSTSGGASLVVKPSITSPAQLKGKKIASPQLGNTQDVALRYWLSTQGLKSDVEGGGDVAVIPQKNAAALTAFQTGAIDGGWEPEPYATQFVEKGAKVLVDERSLWPGGSFVTTNVIVCTQFLTEHPDAVKAFLEAHLDALDLIGKDPTKAQTDVAAQIKKITEQDSKASTLSTAWKSLSFTADPLPASLKTSAEHAKTVGLLKDAPSDGFAGLYDLGPLNAALTARGHKEVATS
jgi:NitT/TauT family transport system substrate-binding protein